MDLYGFILVIIPGLVVYLCIHISKNQSSSYPEYCILVLGLLLGFPVIIIFWGIENWIFSNNITSIIALINNLQNSASIIWYLLSTLIFAPFIAFIFNKVTVIFIPSIQDKIHKRPFESIEDNVWQQITRQYFTNHNIRLIMRISKNDKIITCGETKSLSSFNCINNKELLLMHESIIKQYLEIYDDFQEAIEYKNEEKILRLQDKNTIEYIATYYNINDDIKIELFDGKNLPN